MRISDWSSDVCSSDLVECFLGGARGLLALGRQYRRRTRGREISHFDRRQESDRRGLLQRHVAQRLAIFRTAADRLRRISGETTIPDFFLIDPDAMPTEEDPRNRGKQTRRAHARHPVTNPHLVYRPPLEKPKHIQQT